MKKVVSLIMVLLMVAGLSACSKAKKQEALLNYINQDLKKFTDMETDMLASYGNVSGENFTDGETARKEMADTVLPLATELTEAASELVVDDPEIKELHLIYIECNKKRLEAFNYILETLNTYSSEAMENANAAFVEVTNLSAEFNNVLNRLVSERDVTLNSTQVSE